MKRILYVAALLLASCGSDRVAGTGSQTGNSIVAGRILRIDSTSASNIALTLTPASWLPDSGDGMIRSVVTDSSGKYRFEGIPAGLWRLESCTHDAALTRVLRVAADHDSVLPPLVGRKHGNLVVEVHLDDTLRNASLVVPGSSIAHPLATSHYEIYVPLQGLAPGSRYLVLRGKDGRMIRETNAFVRSGMTDTVRYTAWSRTIDGPRPDGDHHEDDEED